MKGGGALPQDLYEIVKAMCPENVEDSEAVDLREKAAGPSDSSVATTATAAAATAVKPTAKKSSGGQKRKAKKTV